MFGFPPEECVLSWCRGGVEKSEGDRPCEDGHGVLRGPEALLHAGNAISESQMLSGHHHRPSQAWSPPGHTNTQLEKTLDREYEALLRDSFLVSSE